MPTALASEAALYLSMPHLIFLKELTDHLQLSFSQTLGLCLVAAGHGADILLKDVFDQEDDF
jgi:hypothetical protein